MIKAQNDTIFIRHQIRLSMHAIFERLIVVILIASKLSQYQCTQYHIWYEKMDESTKSAIQPQPSKEHEHWLRILCHLLYIIWLDPPRCRNTQTVRVMDWQSPGKWDSSKHYIKHAFLMFICCFQVPYCMWFQCWFVCIVNYNALGPKGTSGIFVLCFCVKLVHLATILTEA